MYAGQHTIIVPAEEIHSYDYPIFIVEDPDQMRQGCWLIDPDDRLHAQWFASVKEAAAHRATMEIGEFL